MKIALYIEDGLEQVVLTPETDTERLITKKLSESKKTLSIYQGSFYHCQGGWIRQSGDDSSAIIVMQDEETLLTDKGDI